MNSCHIAWSCLQECSECWLCILPPGFHCMHF
uniref:Uncharacterized protein n=1 Tax=Arundo donax TaxID=35708 RepID=A0A0A9AQ40_ARUDO